MKKLLALFAVFLLSPAVRAENWPAWRGADGQGISHEKNLPVKWSATENVLWKVPVPGAGVSTPVVWGDRIFLTASDGRLNDQLHVICFHRKDGKKLWHRKFFGTAPTNQYDPGGMAVPTPVTDGQNLYVLFGTGDLFCLDLDGKPRWIRSLAQEYGPFSNRWGMASSPILVGESLVIQVDHWSQSYLLAVDRTSGKNIWKQDRDAHVNWTSPLAVKVGSQTQIITVGSEKAIGYDAKDGQMLWSVQGLDDQCVPTPVLAKNLLLVGCNVNSLAIRLDGKKGDLTNSHVVWKNKKARAYVPSPLHYQGCFYIAGEGGLVTCLDAGTGKQLWKERLGGQFHASPVAGDDKVYFTGKEGSVHVIRGGKTFEFLYRNDMGEMIVASPAISSGQIFLRGEKHLFCVGNAKKGD